MAHPDGAGGGEKPPDSRLLGLGHCGRHSNLAGWQSLGSKRGFTDRSIDLAVEATMIMSRKMRMTGARRSKRRKATRRATKAASPAQLAPAMTSDELPPGGDFGQVFLSLPSNGR